MAKHDIWDIKLKLFDYTFAVVSPEEAYLIFLGIWAAMIIPLLIATIIKNNTDEAK